MLRTLYSRLALTLFIILCAVGVILMQLVGHATTLYEQEVAQKLNQELAAHIIAEQPLIQHSAVNQPALDHLFHQLMVINPSIELYLLDQSGQILAFSALPGKVKRTQVTLQPIEQFINGANHFPLKGDDPRHLSGRKVFSAAPIENDDGLQGYLYIVLGGEQYDNVVQMLGQSYIVDSSLTVLLVALIVAMLGGLLVFAHLTRRLRKLSGVMQQYADASGSNELSAIFPLKQKARDEIDLLGQQFNEMAAKINAQIAELKRLDGQRREMVANVSHDLRTPLTTMRGYLETLLIKHNVLSEEEQKRYLETAMSHSKRLGKLVEELFELARLDSCEAVVYAEPFSMSELVQDVTQKFELRAQQKSIRLNAQLKPNIPAVYGDIAMMQRVLENLLENSLRYTPQGGHIDINVDVDSGRVVVQVSDTGKGIPEEDVDRIFERYYQPDSQRHSGESAGLGLAIVKRILELHGSMIRVHSERNRGTTFSFGMVCADS